MRNRVLIVLSIVIFSFQSYAKDYKLKVKTNSSTPKTAYIIKVRGYKFTVIDSAKRENQNFEFNIKATQEPCFLKFKLDKHSQQSAEIIFNNENIELSIEDDKLETIEVIKSIENKYLNEFYLEFNPTNELLSSLLSTLLLYPSEEEFYISLKKEYDRVYNLLQKQINSLNNSNLFAAAYIKSDLSVIPNLETPLDKQREFVLKNYFNNIDFSNKQLINTELIPRKLFQYFNITGVTRMPIPQQTKILKELIKELMYRAQNSLEMSQFLAHIFSSTFQRGMLDLYYFVRANYDFSTIANKQLNIGDQVPNFNTVEFGTKELHLDEYKTNYKTLYFFSSNSKEIKPTLEFIHQIEKSKTNTLLSFNLDTDSFKYIDFKLENKLPKYTVTRREGYASDEAADYGVRQLPMFFVVNKDNKLVLKTNSLEEFKKFCQTHRIGM